ncbi:hypothetical protein COXBURSA334_0532 [Coxiella burnetii Q321]|nr:hypothetical protein COXBURSA334_0532 [Coxiella burnetii Q321]
MERSEIRERPSRFKDNSLMAIVSHVILKQKGSKGVLIWNLSPNG